MRWRGACFVVLLFVSACPRADEAPGVPSPSPRAGAASPAAPTASTPRTSAPPAVVADDEVTAPALGRARSLAHQQDHLGAIAALDHVLEVTPDDAHALAMRGHQSLYVSGEPARVRARADLERASTLAATDPRLASAIAFNLGLLADREGQGSRALVHYAAANRLRASAQSRAHASGTRECTITITEEDAPRDIVTTYREAATRVRRVVEAESPEVEETEEEARGSLCGESTPCSVGRPVVGIGGGFDVTWANVIVPLGPDRIRVVPGLLRAGAEYHCAPHLDGEVVSVDHWVASRITLTESEAVEEDEHGRACDPFEDGHCMRGCFWSRRRVANVYIHPRDGRAVVVTWSAPTREDRAGEGRVAAYHEVDVIRTAIGVRVRGCGVDRVLMLRE